LTGIDLTKYAEEIDRALADRTPCTVATAAKDGSIDIGLKGSVMVFDKDHLAYLERTLGTHLQNVKENPHVAIMYYNREASSPMVRFFGVAEVLESGPVRDEIRNRTVEPERSRDPENKAASILIRIDKIIEPRNVIYTRE
jgi:hypothetical protein